MIDHIVWKQFRPYLHEKGMVIVPPKNFLADPWQGYLLLVNKEQRDMLLADDFVVASHLAPESLIVDMRLKGFVLEVYTVDSDTERGFLHFVPSDEDDVFQVDEDTFFIPICYHDKTN